MKHVRSMVGAGLILVTCLAFFFVRCAPTEQPVDSVSASTAPPPTESIAPSLRAADRTVERSGEGHTPKFEPARSMVGFELLGKELARKLAFTVDEWGAVMSLKDLYRLTLMDEYTRHSQVTDEAGVRTISVVIPREVSDRLRREFTRDLDALVGEARFELMKEKLPYFYGALENFGEGGVLYMVEPAEPLQGHARLKITRVLASRWTETRKTQWSGVSMVSFMHSEFGSFSRVLSEGMVPEGSGTP